MVKRLDKVPFMTESQFIRVVNCLLTCAGILIYHSVLLLPRVIESHIAAHEAAMLALAAAEAESETPPVSYVAWREVPQEGDGPKENIYLTEELDLRNTWQSLDISYTYLHTEYLGRYFITAYCPAECGGSWTTSSGATCHQSSTWTEPNTVAIDRRYHKYGELLLIGDPTNPNNRQIVVTEDTGPGVRGLWCDVFVETMYEVDTWNTRYDSVWSVSYYDGFVPANDRKEMHETLNFLIHQPLGVFETLVPYR